MIKLLLFTLLSLTAVGCLQTRTSTAEREQKDVLRDQVKSMQATSANQNSRYEELQESMRALNGRLESLESKIDSVRNDKLTTQNQMAQGDQRTQEKMRAYEEAISKLEQEVQSLGAAVSAKSEAMEQVKKEEQALSANPLEVADQRYAKKNWKDAILAYEKYRQENPKGKHYPKATLRMAQSFEEMGLKKEAKAFYEEIVNEYPKSAEAKVAQTRLKKK